MKSKSIFSKIMTIIVVALICLILTVVTALLLGSVNTDIFDFSNLNISNMLPVLIIGGFISCVAVGILVLFLAKEIFAKAKNEIFTKDNGGNEK